MTNPTTTSVIDLASASFDDNEATFVPAANRKSRQAASPATSTNTSSDAVLLIPVDRVRVLKNVRATLDKKGIEQLATSIRNEGQLAPIVVQKLDDDSYGIVFGHRRHAAIALNAAKHNGHGLVRCTVRNNVKAEDLAFIQLACRSTRSCCSSHTIPHGEKQRQRFSRQVLPTSRRPTSRRALLLSSAQLVTGRSNSSQTASSAATRRHPTNQRPHSKTPPSPHTASPRTSSTSTWIASSSCLTQSAAQWPQRSRRPLSTSDLRCSKPSTSGEDERQRAADRPLVIDPSS